MSTPPSPEDVARHVCADRGFTFVRPVGAGAFKETFQVTTPDGTALALKVFRPGFPAERTQREVDAMTRCSHRNIGKLDSIDVVQVQGSPVVVALEEFLSGGTLTERLLNNGPFDVATVLDLGEQLIDAIAHVASHDLVHRDLKPDNILFRDSGVSPVVVDFGLVRDLTGSSLTQTWLMRGPGTPLFAPPEQLRNEKQYIDWRSDQFSLGVVLSYAAFGFHPYEAEGIPSVVVVDRVAERKPMAQRFRDASLNAGLPILPKMVEAWPIRRYRKPEDLARAWRAQRKP
jgi:serine/threonine protein kinase